MLVHYIQLWSMKGSFLLSTYILPPSNFEFSVTIIAPIQTMTKTCANSGPPSPSFSLSDDPWSIVAMNVHKINGPHRSPAKQTLNESSST